jgi:hypothetical protein
MARSRRESHHNDGITDPARLQQTSATKSAQSGHRAAEFKCPLLGVKRTSGEGCKAASTDCQTLGIANWAKVT